MQDLMRLTKNSHDIFNYMQFLQQTNMKNVFQLLDCIKYDEERADDIFLHEAEGIIKEKETADYATA